MKHIILLSDSHGSLDERFFPYFKKADEIWHAGDIGDLTITDKLKEFSKLRAVWGNIDNQKIRSEFKKEIYFKCEDVKVMMTHIGGYPDKYNKRILPMIKKNKPNLFISGHSHILKVMYDKKNKLLHMNPGAIGNFGIHRVKTLLSFKINNDEIKDLNVIEFTKNLTNPIC
ncbi:MAG: YfcE family phosphodiesterase [Flavobacteriales bacterium]|nr:YfcE family phosphodiesterase [Flavobacteriales bacterium]MAU37451.1 YfcE family phosphodiesterase [Flavobacteriales bacterium]|tara:strand:- start:17116 stop:17628 length:513 start_codon:yes stop_codon:yes gene_type:complete